MNTLSHYTKLERQPVRFEDAAVAIAKESSIDATSTLKGKNIFFLDFVERKPIDFFSLPH